MSAAINRNAMTTRRAVLFGGLAASLVARRARAQDKPQHTITAVASISILGDLVHNVGGDRVEVTTLIGPNGDAHVYSPTPGDAKRLAAANIVFVNGLGLDSWMTRLARASGTAAPMITVSVGIAPRRLNDEGKSGRSAIDPHAWQSVANAKIYVANIRDGLDAIDPAGKPTYDANAAFYLAKLDVLEEEVRAAIANIPADRRKIITTHDAFGYFGDAYGMQFISPEGVSTDAEPSAKDVGKIIALIRKENIPAIFKENISDPRMMEQIAGETGARLGGKLYSDALSAPSGPAATYIDMMRHNVRELTVALNVVPREGG
jgi:zinc/manganese transport system substrate-binding protein